MCPRFGLDDHMRSYTGYVAIKGGDIMAKNESTSAKVASKASKLLSNPKTPKNVKSVAASALTQKPGKKGK